jgi:ABC-2 type transport system permease protein
LLNSVLLKTLRDQRRTFLWWSAGLSAVNALIIILYPSVEDVPELDAIMESMPEALARLFMGDVVNLTSPEGYLNSQLFILVLPLLFLVFTIGRGSGAIAGEEERGTLDLLLSLPVRRSQVVLEKFVAMVAATMALGLVSWLSMAAAALAVGMEIDFVRLGEVTLSCTLLGLAFGAMALALGCAKGSRGLCLGVTSALAIAAYFLNALAPIAESLEPAQKLSPFYLYIGADPLTSGLNLVHAGVLTGLTTAFLAIGVVLFGRRDLA